MSNVATSAAIWSAPAKLNLMLHIVGRRPDGYHELQTVFQLMDLADRLDITVRMDGVISRPRGPAGVEEDDDLVMRAARALQQQSRAPLGANITMHKRIPMGGGLGGGSSDAATTLVALNQMWRLGLTFGAIGGNWQRIRRRCPRFRDGKVRLGGGNWRKAHAGHPGGGFLVPGRFPGSCGADRIGIPGS